MPALPVPSAAQDESGVVADGLIALAEEPLRVYLTDGRQPLDVPSLPDLTPMFHVPRGDHPQLPDTIHVIAIVEIAEHSRSIKSRSGFLLTDKWVRRSAKVSSMRKGRIGVNGGWCILGFLAPGMEDSSLMAIRGPFVAPRRSKGLCVHALAFSDGEMVDRATIAPE